MSAQQSWYQEKQSAWLYRALAAAEPDARKSQLFLSLAEAAETQAGLWEERIAREDGKGTQDFHPSLHARLVARLIRLLGPRRSRPLLTALKLRGMSVYEGDVAQLGHPMPTSAAEVGQRHAGATASGNLRAAVFGINDGLVSNTSLIMGVAGATGNPEFILLTGVAGLLAGALSMAAGEYVSVRSQRELYEYQIGLERAELEQYPEEEAEELALIYNARGLPLSEARRLAAALMQDPDHALDTLAREELGLNPEDLGSPLGAGASSFLAFAVGGVIPLAPFLIMEGDAAVGIAAGLAGVALFAVGSALSLFTGRRLLRGGARMLLIGGAAGLATHLIGRLLGVGLS